MTDSPPTEPTMPRRVVPSSSGSSPSSSVSSSGSSREVPAAPAELDGLLCFDLYAASRAVTAAYRPLLFSLGLTYPQYLVLTVLWARRECPIKYLAETLRLDHGTLTPLLRRMADAGLLTRERDADDERIVTIRLAPAGDALRRHADDVRCHITEALGIDAATAAELQGVLRLITASAIAHS